MIRNGQIWESPSKLLAIVQELESDMWVVLGTPTPVVGGGTAMRVVHFPLPIQMKGAPHAEILHTRAQLELLLKDWRLRKDLTLDWLG